jgi:hypothetical protein
MKTAFYHTTTKFKSWPRIYTNNLNDYSQVEKYKSLAPYVWLINPDYELIPSFNYNFSPFDQNKFMVHSFPRCSFQTKRPLSWDAVKLVPTHRNISDTILKQRSIASYGTPGFLIIHAFNDPIAVKKLNNFESTESPYQLVKRHNNYDDFIQDINLDYTGEWVWIVDIDFEHTKSFKFDYIPEDVNSVYYWKVKHDSTNLEYADRTVMLVHESYILDLQAGRKPKHKEIVQNNVAGILHDTSNPYKSWARAYSNTMQLLTNALGKVNKRDRNRILETMLASDNDYIKHACVTATNDVDNTIDENEKTELYNNSQDYKWLEEKFKQVQQERLASLKTI